MSYVFILCFSYLGRAHLLSASSLKRPRPKLAKEEVRPSTNPVVASQGGRQSSLLSRYGPKQKKELLQPLTPQSQRRRGAGLSSVEKLPVSEHKLKRSTREVDNSYYLALSPGPPSFSHALKTLGRYLEGILDD